jgi:hypothetical protein
MLRIARSLQLLLFVVLAAASGLVFGAQRTFVASTGSDANTVFNCSLVKPCRGFAAAIGVTNANGEVIVLDSAGYGPVTITQSVSIIAPAGIYGGISVFSGHGITINGSAIVVVLRGLTINGLGGDTGIAFAQGAKLTVEECEIANMTGAGINAAAPTSTVTVKNTVMRDSGYGIAASADSRVTVANSVLANNAIGVFVTASGGVVTDVMVTHSIITGSSYGLYAGADDVSTTRLVSDGNAINNVAGAAFYFPGGLGTETIYTSGNNTVGFNNGIAVGGSLTPIGMH